MVDRVRELLDRYGEQAVALDSKLREIGHHRTSMRMIAIAEALQDASLLPAPEPMQGWE